MFVFVLVRLVAIGRQSIGCGSYASTRGGVGSGFGTGSSALHFGLETEEDLFPLEPDHNKALQFLRNFLKEHAYMPPVAP